ALGQSLSALVSRSDFQAGKAHVGRVARMMIRALGPVLLRVPGAVLVHDPAARAAAFQRALVELPRETAERVSSAATRADRIRRCTVELNALFWRVRRYLSSMIAGFVSLALLKRLARGRWANDVRADVDVLLRGLPGNVTTQMDLAVGDLTDLVRRHPELATLLKAKPWAEAQATLQQLQGGRELSIALESFLSRYGNRCASEIDLSRPRWRDDPTLLLRVMMGGLSGEPGAHRRNHQAQIDAGEAAAARLVAAAG